MGLILHNLQSFVLYIYNGEGKVIFYLMFLLFTTMHGGVEACSHRWIRLIVVVAAAHDRLPLVRGLKQQ